MPGCFAALWTGLRRRNPAPAQAAFRSPVSRELLQAACTQPPERLSGLRLADFAGEGNTVTDHDYDALEADIEREDLALTRACFSFFSIQWCIECPVTGGLTYLRAFFE